MSIVFTICESFTSGEPRVADRVCELLDGLDLAIPYTTRPRRSADDNGFVFTSRDVFERLIASQEFLEYGEIFGNYYGTPHRSLQEARDKGNDLLIKVDVRGLAQIKEKVPDAVSILVLHTPTGQHEHGTGSMGYFLYERSRTKYMQHRDKFDHVIANDRLEKNTNQVAALIRGERSRRS